MQTHLSETGLKISFCTTCRGEEYLELLKKTLPENIKRNTGPNHYSNIEFVIVAYGDPQVTEWLKTNYANEIRSGLIRAVDVPVAQAEYFKMAHAKNIAHRMATGDVLCNLDCDNITGENFSGWLNEHFTNNPDIVVCATTTDKFKRKLYTGSALKNITGRIAISRENFEKLHGYDEKRNAAQDGDDTNLKERAYATGLRSASLALEQFGDVMQHSDNLRIAHMSPEDQSRSEQNFQRKGSWLNRIGTVRRVMWGEHTVLPNSLRGANPNGDFGCAEVTLLDKNLNPESQTLNLMPHPEWIAAFNVINNGQPYELSRTAATLR